MRRVLVVVTVTATAAALLVGCSKGNGSSTGSGSGSGATTGGTADREVPVKAVEYSFEAPEDIAIKSGETIKLTLTNGGKLKHELEVFAPDGDTLGEVPPTDAGKSGSVVITFKRPGTYKFVCGVDDHKARGMTMDVTVT
jgi:uncharacterized cupredoxin-like copper-binding protein